MPFYEYQCSACGAQTEVLQKITDAPLRKCPECGRNQLKKLVSAPVFRLKGGGWYETDFKSDKDNKRNLVEAERDRDAGKDSSAEKDAKADKPEGSASDKDSAAKKPESDAASKPASGEKTAKAKTRPAPVPASRSVPKKAASKKPAPKQAAAKSARARSKR